MTASRRGLFAAVVFVGLSAPAFGQITWSTPTYSDGNIGPGGFGFADNSVGQLRRDSVTKAFAYLSTVLDGRGTVQIQWNTSSNLNNGTLASFGASLSSGFVDDGYFLGRPVYERARSNTSFTANPAGAGRVNFHSSVDWHYDVTGSTTTLDGSYDLVSVIIHEIGHGLGFASGVNDHTTGRGGNPWTNLNNPQVGTTRDWYGTWDRWLQRGTGDYESNAIFRTDRNVSTYGTVNTSRIDAFTGGNSQNNSSTTFTNDTDEGLYFGGTYAREVFRGPVPVYSPTSFAGGSSLSHVNVGPTANGTGYGEGAIGLMNFSADDGVIRRFQAYEIAMLMDMGWNVYNWNSTGGDWSDGETSLANSRWTTDSGIVLAANGSTTYNTFDTTNNPRPEAPVLPVYGKDTANIVLNFKGSGAQNYTSTNDLPHAVRLSRLNLNSSSSNTITVAGGTLNFGLNADGTASVLVPKVVQSGSGAFDVSSTLQTNTIATQTQTVSGVDVAVFRGHSGITVDGGGTGTVTLSGKIVGTGGMTKDGGGFTLVQSGSNSYTGATTVKGGVLSVSTLANGGVTRTVGTNGTTTATVDSTDGLSVGMTLSTATVPFGTTITAIDTATNTITLSTAATASGSGTATIGTANGIGISSNAASNLVVGGGTLRYTGAAVSTDRLFSLGYGVNGTATGKIENNGTGALTFTNTGGIGFGTDTQTVQVVTQGSSSITLFPGGGARVQEGQIVTGTGIPSNTTVTAVSVDGITGVAVITLSNAATSSGTFRDLTFAGGNRTLELGGTYTGGANSLAAVVADPGVGTFTTGVTKSGPGTWVLSGNNTYSGGTTVSGGTLVLNGSVGGAVTVNSGGTLEAAAGVGELTVKNDVTVESGGTLRAELGGGGTADRIDMSSGTHTLDLKSGSLLALDANGFSRGGTTTFTLADLNGTTAGLLKINGGDVAAGTDITVFTSSGGTAGSNSNKVGDVDLSLSNFNLTSGDTLTLRRESGSGDLVIVFSPIPEPAGVLAVCGLAAAGGVAWRRWRKRAEPTTAA